MAKRKYEPKTFIGPNNIYFKEEAPPRYSKTNNGRSFRRGIFICPVCQKEFETDVLSVSSGHTKSCGCTLALDLTNKKFGNLTALYLVKDKKDKSKNNFWHCRCDCGIELDVAATSLKNHRTTSCGCKGFLNLVGQRFGKLVVIRAYSRGSGNVGKKWLCKCDCGQETLVTTSHLMSKHTTSCGCLKSKGEQKIAFLLNELNLNFEQQKTFKDCINPKTNRKLKFDFYLPDYNTCIEYDGEQHFTYSNIGWNSKEKFQQIRYRDNLKDLYCKNNNICLIRIPYTHFSRLTTEYLLQFLK